MSEGATLTHTAIDTVTGISPSILEAQLPAPIDRLLFAGDQACFAIIDAARVQFLAERLDAEGLDAACLYDGDEALQAVAPWLVALRPEEKLTRSLFDSDPTGKNHFALFDLDAAVFLRSHLTLGDLRSWLRRYTALPDERNTRRFLRLAQPGYLAALLTASASGPGFFKGIDAHIYMLPTLEAGEREVWLLKPDRELAHQASLPVIDQPVRAAFHRLRNDLAARALARADGGDIALRQRRHDTYFRAMQAGFDAPPTLQRTDRLLAQTPADDHPTFWAAAARGDWSLGYLCKMMAARHGIDEGLAS